MAINSLVNMQQMFGSPTPDPYGVTQRLQTGLGQQRAQISSNIAQDNANKISERSDKNYQLGLMLYALGGALRGDKNFVENTIQLQQMRKSEKKEEEKEKAWEKALKNLEGRVDPSLMQLAEVVGYEEGATLVAKGLEEPQPFEGTGLTNQYLNILEKGKNDPDLRRTTQYRIAYNNLTTPKTETYLNEFGQQVRREIPSVAQPGVYPPPISLDAPTVKPDAIPEPVTLSKPTDEETVLQISPERRKELQTQLDTSQNVLERLDSLDKVIDTYDPGFFTVGTERAEVGSSYNDLLLVLKDYARLGVLAGPDLDLLNNWVGDPMGFWQNVLYEGAEGTKVQTAQLRAAIRRGEEKLKKQMGLAVETPQGTKTQQNVYLNGRQLILNSEGTGWIYKDTGEPAQ
jgi:hypothetical protein